MASPRTQDRKLELLVIQPTPLCNLNCSYCYLPNRADRARMPARTIENTFRKVLNSDLADPRIIVLWHAGEPLTVGVEWFEEAVRLAALHKPDSTNLTHSLQTNATLLNDSWCRFLLRERFEIGVSIDGPAYIHDSHRKTWSGRGSFAQVMAGIRKLREYDLEFGALAVLTTTSIDYPDEIYDFFKELGTTSVGFNIEEIEHVHALNTFSQQVEAPLREKYRRFFYRLLERVDRDQTPLKIREIEQLIKITTRIQADATYVYEPMEVRPFRILTILHNGDVSPFSPEFAGMPSLEYKNFCIGNIDRDEFAAIFERLSASALNKDVNASVDACRSKCSFFQICGGGYFSNKWSENRTLLQHETQACRFHTQTVAKAYLDYLHAS